MKTIVTIGISLIGACAAATAGSIFCEAYLLEEKEDVSVKLKKNIWMFGVFAVIAVIGGFLYTGYGYSVSQMIRRFVVLYTVIAVARIDRRKYIIPNKAVLFLFIMQMILLLVDFFVQRDEWFSLMKSSLWGLVIGGVTFLVGYMISKKGMGLGDVKLLAAMGFCLGDTAAVPIILVSLVFSAVYGIVQTVRKKINAKDAIPFAPFVAYASVILLLLGF